MILYNIIEIYKYGISVKLDRKIKFYQFLVVLGAFYYFLSFFNVLTVRTISIVVRIRQKTPITAPTTIATVPF